MPCYSPLKGYVSKETGGLTFKRPESTGEALEVACGQCLGCRLDRSRMWAARIVHEASCHDRNCFLTLTYSPEHLPADGSLRKEDFQKFMKRLRKRFPKDRIRYYHCGEYGDENARPHYHACLFGFDPVDKQVFYPGRDNPLYVSPTLEKLWPFGFHTIGEVTFQSAAYCARYILKKVNGINAHEHYRRVDPDTGETWSVQPEYTTMSRRPGIGMEWFEKYKTDVYPSDEVPVPGHGVVPKAPRYYDEQLKKIDEILFDAVKEKRREFRERNAEEFTSERLQQKYLVKKAQTSQLKRGMIEL